MPERYEKTVYAHDGSRAQQAKKGELFTHLQDSVDRRTFSLLREKVTPEYKPLFRAVEKAQNLCQNA